MTEDFGPNRRLFCQVHSTTRGPIEHPLRKFKRPLRIVPLKAAANNIAIAASNALNQLGLEAVPGMPWVEDFANDANNGSCVVHLYNVIRPHSSLDYRPSAPGAQPWSEASAGLKPQTTAEEQKQEGPT